MTRYYYYADVWERDELDVECAFAFDYNYDNYDIHEEYDADTIVCAMAADYLSNHDGWEHSSWPNSSIKFAVWDSDKKYVGKFDVYLEYEPSFSAYKLKD